MSFYEIGPSIYTIVPVFGLVFKLRNPLHVRPEEIQPGFAHKNVDVALQPRWLDCTSLPNAQLKVRQVAQCPSPKLIPVVKSMAASSASMSPISDPLREFDFNRYFFRK